MIKILMGSDNEGFYTFNLRRCSQLCEEFVKFYMPDKETYLSEAMTKVFGRLVSMVALFAGKKDRSSSRTMRLDSTESSKMKMAKLLAGFLNQKMKKASSAEVFLAKVS